MVLAPDWKKDFKTISAVDVYTDKELNNSFELCIDEVCEHENQRLDQYSDLVLLSWRSFEVIVTLSE
jgi:hypothetical protein